MTNQTPPDQQSNNTENQVTKTEDFEKLSETLSIEEITLLSAAINIYIPSRESISTRQIFDRAYVFGAGHRSFSRNRLARLEKLGFLTSEGRGPAKRWLPIYDSFGRPVTLPEETIQDGIKTTYFPKRHTEGYLPSIFDDWETAS